MNLSAETVPRELAEEYSQAQQELGNRTRQLMAVARLSRRVLASPELRKLLMKETVALIARVLRVDYVKFLVLLPHGKAFRLQADVSWPDDLGSQSEIPVTPDSVAGYTLRRGMPVIVQDRRTDPRFEASVAITERDLVSGMSVVVGAAEAPQGVLCAYTSNRRTFVEKELLFLLAAAKALGIVIEREATESRMHRLRDRLLSASRASAMAELGTLLAHQLNQPLSALVNYVQACRRKIAFSGAQVPEQIYQLMDVIDKAVREAERAASILRRFRALVPSGELHTLEEDINRTLKDAASLALADAAEKQIEVRYRLDPKLPKVVIDAIQIQQVLYELIRHAVGSLEHSQRRQLILSTQLADGGMVEVQVADTGEGIDPTRRDQLMLLEGISEDGKDGAIALAIGRSIIETHGGKLWVSDTADGGATFHFTVPVSSDKGSSF